MSLTEAIKVALKRGAFVTAANWEVVVIQFVADSAFKALLMVPVLGAAFLLALIVGSTVTDVDCRRLRRRYAGPGHARRHRAALAAYLSGVHRRSLGGSVLMFIIKSGTVVVLVARSATRPPSSSRHCARKWCAQGGRFSLESFTDGCAHLDVGSCDSA